MSPPLREIATWIFVSLVILLMYAVCSKWEDIAARSSSSLCFFCGDMVVDSLFCEIDKDSLLYERDAGDDHSATSRINITCLWLVVISHISHSPNWKIPPFSQFLRETHCEIWAPQRGKKKLGFDSGIDRCLSEETIMSFLLDIVLPPCCWTERPFSVVEVRQNYV